MTETKRWAIAILVSLVVAFGGNYWMTTINQARGEERVVAIVEDVVRLASEIEDVKSRHLVLSNVVQENVIANARSDEIMKTLVDTTSDLNKSVSKLTEVVIRLEERDKLSSRN